MMFKRMLPSGGHILTELIPLRYTGVQLAVKDTISS